MSKATDEEQALFNAFKDDDKLAMAVIATFDTAYKRGFWAGHQRAGNDMKWLGPIVGFMLGLLVSLAISVYLGG